MKHSKETKKILSEQAKLRIGIKAPNWKGGRMVVDGYIYIYSPHHPFCTKNKYVCEHRLIMEKYLGRFLNSREVVHHIDGNKENNNIENLKLFINCGNHTLECHINR